MVVSNGATACAWCSRQVTPLDHAVLQVERAVVDGEGPIPAMVQGSPFRAAFIEPDPLRLEDEEVVGVAQPVIDDDTFDVGQAIREKGSRDLLRGPGPQAKPLKLVEIRAGTVSDIDNGFGQIEAWHGNHAFTGLAKRVIAMIPGADHTANERRIVLDHHVEAHCQDIGLAVVVGRHQHDRARFKQTVCLRCG
ncbi:Hypothetical protein AT6N2_L1106 [Agrobacterium tumefaciens]|nr:Hypothetical protein AT6N2_L1106 [Agrobacterium tumefaciens]